MDYVDSIKKIIRQFFKEEQPDILSIHYPVFGKISRAYTLNGIPFVDVKILDKNKEVDANFPELPAVKGQYAKGQIVRLMFYYNNLDMPYIDGVVE